MPRLRTAIFSVASSEIKLTVVLKSGLAGPPLPFVIEASDMAFVLKCKIECALKLLNETQPGSVGKVAPAEDIEQVASHRRTPRSAQKLFAVTQVVRG